jgi:copper chaperone NosL
MSNDRQYDRRDVMKILAAVGLGGLTGSTSAAEDIGALLPGKGWMAATGQKCPGDGTPLQFIPKTPPDAKPLENELQKYPKCPYCGMDRTKFNHSRHLVQYGDDLVDGTCSIHCLAISLSLNLDRMPKAIYAADFGAADAIKPMVEVDKATYLIGSELKGTMTKTSKMAFASADAAKAAQAAQGGQTAGFDEALRRSYLDMVESTVMVRKRRAESRARMMKKD